MPSPMEEGVLGMMRITGYAPPAWRWMSAMVSPAAMGTRKKRSFRAASTGAMSESISAIIWGFTPRKR